jgi:hypothetical protein
MESSRGHKFAGIFILIYISNKLKHLWNKPRKQETEKLVIVWCLIHNYNTRNASLLHKGCTRKNYKKHSLSNNGIDVWNNFPTLCRQIRSLPVSKSTKKVYFLLSNLNN